MLTLKSLCSSSDDEESCHETPSSSFSRQSPTLLQQLHVEALHKRSEQSEQDYRPSHSQYPWGNFDQILLQFYNGDYQKYKQLQLFDDRFERELYKVEIDGEDTSNELGPGNESAPSKPTVVQRIINFFKPVNKAQRTNGLITIDNGQDHELNPSYSSVDIKSSHPEPLVVDLTVETKRSIDLRPDIALQHKKSRRQRVLHAVLQQNHDDFEKRKIRSWPSYREWLCDRWTTPHAEVDGKSFDLRKIRAIRRPAWSYPEKRS